MDVLKELVRVEQQIAELTTRRNDLRDILTEGMVSDGVAEEKAHGYAFRLRRKPPKLQYIDGYNVPQELWAPSDKMVKKYLKKYPNAPFALLEDQGYSVTITIDKEQSDGE